MTADTDITDRPYGSSKPAAPVGAPTLAEVDECAREIIANPRAAHTAPLGIIRALAALRLDALEGKIVKGFAAGAAEGAAGANRPCGRAGSTAATPMSAAGADAPAAPASGA